ncbi:response regulator transcription factor [Clostridium sp. NSJ-6]|uniref:Stage 0 sporulation protein A homolog n=1 Tax=Clostridium hominis TaxID=2763036 RepID=A0ABR7DGA0_9CLOT|nr:response regulator transcription factor [Clostridium hominis]MBC5630435.1 response regulator transcription factor [Clostridium hominis]MDU2670848.1 response regulator transcription factor [Clostridium sp.]
MRENILIIEDDEDISEILSFSLKQERYNVKVNPNGLEAEEEITTFKPDLILLDIMLNDTDGFSVCRKVAKYKIPIIMLTARGEIMDKILGLELGADDYITKPFDIREVIARIRVSLRRRSELIELLEESDSNAITYGRLKVNEDSRIVLLNNEEVKLKPKEFDLLLFLLKNKNMVHSRDKLLDLVWGYDFSGDTRTVDVHITRLRQKIQSEVNIETVFGIGYMLKENYVNDKA